MKIKKTMALLLSAAMAVTSLTGCGKSKATTLEGSDSNVQTAESNEGRTRLTAVFVKHSATKDVNEMQWLQELEDACNVEIEWQQISADWDQKKSTLFASGDIPDILINATTDSDYIQFSGVFEDMGTLIENNAPNVQLMFEEHPELKTLATMESGEIYGLPRYKRVWPFVTASMMINKTWLDNLGLKVPETWDELEQTLIAFRDEDPNGNGKKDEIPMMFNSFNGEYSPKLFLGSLGLPLSNNAADGYFAEDGVVKNYFVDERYKTLVKWLQKMNGEGLIDPECFTQDWDRYISRLRGNGDGETAAVGFTWGWAPEGWFESPLCDQYVVIEPLKYSEDSEEPIYINDEYYQNYGANAIAMSASCKNKEAAMRFIDGFYDKKVSMQVLFGGMNDQDKGISDNGDGTYTVLEPADPAKDSDSWKWENTFADNGPFYIADDMTLNLSAFMQNTIDSKKIYDQYNQLDPKKDVYPQAFMKYTQDDTNIMAMNQANINNMTESQSATWVFGTNDIDAEWDSYVEEVYDVGLKENLELRQKAYDSYVKTLE